MIRPFSLPVLLAALLTAAAAPAAHAGLVFKLDPPTRTGTSASIGVGIDFTNDNTTGGDTIDGIQLDVSGSDAPLTANGTDFSRFSFELADPTRFFTTGFGSEGALLIGFNDSGDALMPDIFNFKLGTILVDLAGVDRTSPLLASLANGNPDFITDASGTIDGVGTGSYASAGLVRFDPTAVDLGDTPPVAAVPEPATFIHIAVAGGLGLIALARSRRSARRQEAEPAQA